MEKTSRRSFLRSVLSTSAVVATAGATGIVLTQPACSRIQLMIDPKAYTTNSFNGIKASSFGDRDIHTQTTVLNLTGDNPFYLVQLGDNEDFQFRGKTVPRAELLPFAAIPENEVIEIITPTVGSKRGQIEIRSAGDVTCFVPSQYVTGNPITSFQTDRGFGRAKMREGLVTKVSESKFEMPAVKIEGQAAPLAYLFMQDNGRKVLTLVGNPQYSLTHKTGLVGVSGNVYIGCEGKLNQTTSTTQPATQKRIIVPAIPVGIPIYTSTQR